MFSIRAQRFPDFLFYCSILLFLVAALPPAFAASQPNVQISVTQNNSPLAQGETNPYLITVTNTGYASSGNFSVYASVPGNTTVADAQAGGGGCYNGNWPCQPGKQIYWSNVNLASGQSATYQFAAQLNTPAPLDGTVISTTVSTSNATFPTASISTLVNSSGGLNVAVTCPPSTLSSPAAVECIIDYGNNSAKSINTALSFSIPTGLSVSAISSGGTAANGAVTWNTGQLASGEGGQEFVTMQVPKNLASGSLLNVNAQLSDTTGSQYPANGSSSLLIASINPLQIAVSATPDPVLPGQVVTYTLDVSNTGAASTGNFSLLASVPNGATVASAQAGGGGCYYGSWPCQPGGQIVWSNVDLAAGQSATYQFSAQVNSSSPPATGSLLTSVVTTGLGGSAAANVLVGGGGPVLALAASEQVPTNGIYTYTLSYGNTGTASPSTQLLMAVPPGATFVSASPGGVVNAGVVTWNLGALAPGGGASQQLTVQAAVGAGSVIAAEAEVIDAVSQQSYSRANTATTVASINPLQIAVSATPDPVLPGQVVTYTLDVSNTGAASTGNFSLLASIPNGATVASAQAGGGGCYYGSWPCQPGGQIVWSNVDLAAGQSATYQFSAQVNSSSPPATGSLLTSVVTTGLGGSAAANVLVGGGGPVLALAASEQVPTNGVYTYTLSYGNTGTASPSTQLLMAVPSGTTFVSASPGGVVNAGVVTWNLGILPPATASSLQLIVQANSSAGTVIAAEANLINATTKQSYSRATEETTIASTDPLAISVSSSPNPALPGQPVTYTVKVTNTGASATGNFSLLASIPNGATVASAQAGGGGCYYGSWPCQPGGQIVWSNVNLAAGQSATYQFSAQVNSSSPPANGSLLTSVVTTGLGGAGQGSDSYASQPPPTPVQTPLPNWALMILASGILWIMRRK